MFSTVKSMHYKQPQGFYLLFTTEMWERFGFYMLQFTIVLYMSKNLTYTDHHANAVYAAFSAFLYLTPVAGGYIADRFLGFQRSVLVGGFLFIIGYLMTAIPGETFFWGLAVLSCANGLFKPNISSLLGRLYQRHDPRRESGFTLFYMGINLGSLFPPLIAGWLIMHYGWHSGFGLAAIGMSIGLATFLLGRYRLAHFGLVPLESPLKQSQPKKVGFILVFITSLIIIVSLFRTCLVYPEWANYLMEAGSVVVVLVALFFFFRESHEHRHKLMACFILIIISVFFWTLYNQKFTSLTLFADRNMIPSMFGFKIDAEFMQFFNSFFIIVLSPLLSIFWVRLEINHRNPSIPFKFSLGILATSLGFIVLGIGARYFGEDGMLSPWWLVSSYLFQTLGELLLSPIGLSMITVLAPKHLVGVMMGIWFFVQAMAFILGSHLANWAAVPQGVPPVESLPIYTHAFTLFAVLSLIFTVISFMLVPFLSRLITQDE